MKDKTNSHFVRPTKYFDGDVRMKNEKYLNTKTLTMFPIIPKVPTKGMPTPSK